MLLTPDYILDFGANKGYSLAEVYKYLPSYIEWLIEYTGWFEINPSQFEALPKSILFYSPTKIKTQSGKEIEISPQKIHRGSIKAIMKSDSKDLKEINYKFSEKFLNILKQKLNGEYKVPHYDPPKIIGRIKG